MVVLVNKECILIKQHAIAESETRTFRINAIVPFEPETATWTVHPGEGLLETFVLVRVSLHLPLPNLISHENTSFDPKAQANESKVAEILGECYREM